MQETRVRVNQVELQIRECDQEGDAVIILHFSGQLHPYGWLLDPEDACTAVLNFLSDAVH